jgi:hypothetical protein
MDLRIVGQALVAGCLVGHTGATLSMDFITNCSGSSNLEEGGLASLADRVDAELVETARRRDGRIIVHPLAAVHRPVVVAVVVHGAVPVEHEAVLADLLVERAWVGLMWRQVWYLHPVLPTARGSFLL